jgi:hypothetical protein
MVADELAFTAGAQVILFIIAFFPVSAYAGALTMGALDFYDYSHNFIVFLCAPVAFTPFIILCRSPPLIFFSALPGEDAGTGLCGTPLSLQPQRSALWLLRISPIPGARPAAKSRRNCQPTTVFSTQNDASVFFIQL